MSRPQRFGVAALLVVTVGIAASPAVLNLKLRSRVEPFKGSGDWRAVSIDQTFPASQTALILCDMWDKHWCSGATARVDVLAHKMAPVVELARERGILIIHAPSDTMDYYKNT